MHFEDGLSRDDRGSRKSLPIEPRVNVKGKLVKNAIVFGVTKT